MKGNSDSVYKFEILQSGSEVSVAYSGVTVAPYKLVVALSGVIWPTFITTGLTEVGRT
jgi:hypothetical protein